MNYRGFTIRKQSHTPTAGFVIYQDNIQYSCLHFASFGAAKKMIDRHLLSPMRVKEEFSIPVPEPANLNTVGRPEGEYSNSGYLSLSKK